MVEWLMDFVNTYLVKFVVNIVLALLVLLIGFKLVKFIVSRLKKGKLLDKLDSNITSLLISATKFVGNALVIIIAIEILGVPSATIIAALGSCGLAIGLALQGGLSNLAGGVMIMIFKPFYVGDYIVTKDGEGTVEEIGIFYTRLVTTDNRGISIPNSVLSSNTVTNLSAKKTRVLAIDIAISYDADLDLARRVLLGCADENELILKDPAPVVVVNEHGDSAVKLVLRGSVASGDYLKARGQLQEATLRALREADLTIPYPQIDVHMQ